MPDKSGLLLTASRIPNRNSRIWQVSAATGETTAVTKDSEAYAMLSMDKTGSRIISTQVKQDYHLRFFNLEKPSVSRPLAAATIASYAPDGKVYFSSGMSGNDEIWSINPDGTAQRQLTNSKEDEGIPIVSPDNTKVIFVSNRSGAAQVWRMNTDGSNQTQITGKEGGFPLLVSPDGQWVYYIHGLSRALWRVSLSTGEEQMVFNKVKPPFAVSPDCAQIVYTEKQGDETALIIASLTDGTIFKTLRLPDKKYQLESILWTRDGKQIGYLTTSRELADNLLWMQSIEENAPRQIAALGEEEVTILPTAFSPDGKNLTFTQGQWLHDLVLLKGLR
jgi:Tol biopolymer transport system component